MKSIQRAHIVVVADSDHGLALAARLMRMDVARVTTVAGLDAARGLCRAGGVDACIVVFDDAAPDAAPVAAIDAPGRPRNAFGRLARDARMNFVPSARLAR